ncbi:MAG TPA: ankyrin repeat domain-containing protein, partial [Leptospiraceae bacterium]|nr:ankyrin repeat domain-containing protein [Leptospiraceae bacterium]
MAIFLRFFILFFYTTYLFSGPTEDLFEAVRKRSITDINRAIDSGADINGGNEWNTTPLMLATHFGAVSIMKALLDKKADPNAINYRNETALRIACQKNFVEGIHLLIDSGADVNEEDVNGANLLMNYSDKHSGKTNELAIIKILVERGANINHQKEDGESVLMARVKDKEIFDYLISKNANLNLRNKDGNTLLHISIENKDIELVKFLLEKGADVNVRNFTGDTPLMQAIYFDQKEMIQMILEKKPDLNLRDSEGMTAIIHAIDKKQRDVIQPLIDRKSDLTVADNKGYTPLMYAILSEEQDIVDMFLEAGADIYAKSQKGFSVFMLACYKGNKKLVQQLLEKGIEIEEPSQAYETALYNAIRNPKNRQYEIAQMLLDRKKKTKRGKYRDYGVLSAAYYNDFKSMQYFIENHFDLNLRDSEGNTAMMIAAERGYADLVNLLLTNKARAKKLNRKKESALTLAVKNNHWAVVQILNPAYKPPPKPIVPTKTVIKKEDRIFKPENQNLIEAIQKEDLSRLISLLNSGEIQINEQYGEKGKSPLMYASFYGSFLCAKYLIQNKADLKLIDSSGSDALLQILHFARLEKDNIIYPSHVFIARLLLANGADVNTKDYAGDSFLYSSAYYNQYELVKTALFYKAKVNQANEKGLTPLHASAWHKNARIVSLLLSYNADVNARDLENRTPLYMVCISKENEGEIIRLLLTKNPDIHIKAKSGLSALDLARANGYGKILSVVMKSVAEEKALEESDKNQYEYLRKEFLDKPLNWKNDKGMSFLELAVRYEKISEVKDLLSKGAEINTYNLELETPLIIACDRGNLELVQMLLANKAEVNFSTKTGNTALMSAAFFGKPEIVKILLENGARASAKNEAGDNALFIAARYGHKAIVQMLLEKRVHVNVLNKHFGSSLMASVKGDEFEIAEMILKKRANPHFKFSDGNNALMMAIERGNKEITRILLERKPRLAEENRKHKTALILAVENGHAEIVRSLLKSNANINEKLFDGSNLLHLSVLRGYRDVMRVLIDYPKKSQVLYSNIDINEKDKNSLTPLMIAAALGDYDSV